MPCRGSRFAFFVFWMAGLLAAGTAGADAKKVLRVGVTAPPVSLDPKQALDNVSGLVCSQVFETPYAVPPGGAAPQPRLFAAPLRSDGPNVWSATIRPGAVFSDGTAVTAALAAASLAKVKSLTERASITAHGDRVVFTLKRPDALLETALSQVFCAVALEKGGKFLGSAPYMPAPAATMNAMVLVRNPRYSRPAPIEEIRFQVFRPTSDGGVSGLLNAVKRGDIDFTNGIPSADLSQVDHLPAVAVDVGPGKATGILFFQTEKPGPLRDPKVRRAIALAIDRAELSRRFFGGDPGFAARSLLPPAMSGGETDGLAFDPAAAQALLAEAQVGKTVELDLLETWTSRPYAPNPAGICRAVAEMLGKIGIRVKVVPSGGTTAFFERTEKGDFDMVLAGWIADTHEPVDFLEAQMASWSVPTPGSRCGSCNNFGRYRSRAVDAALAAWREKRNAASLATVLYAAREDVPFVPLLNGPSVTVLSRRVKGFKASPLSTTFFSSFDLVER